MWQPISRISIAACLLCLGHAAVLADPQTNTAPPVLQVTPLFNDLPGLLPFRRTPTQQNDPDSVQQTLGEFLRAQRVLNDTFSTDKTNPRTKQKTALRELQGRANGPVTFRIHPQTGTPRFLKGKGLQSAAPGPAGTARDEETARRFIRLNATLLQMADPDHELTLRKHETDTLGHRHLRFDQTYQGVPVWPAEMIVHQNADGDVHAVTSGLISTEALLHTQPVHDSAEALTTARDAVPEGETGNATTPKLIIYTSGAEPPRLAWTLELEISFDSHWRVVVAADSGTVLAAYNQVMHANVSGSGVDLHGISRPLNVLASGGQYYLYDTSKPMQALRDPADENHFTTGNLIVGDYRNAETINGEFPPAYWITSSQPDSGWLPDGVSAAFNLSESYDYFKYTHGRDSLDGTGKTVLAHVRLGAGEYHAFYSQGMLYFGDGIKFAGALDIVGHEYTHGVVEHTANLIYQNQSGALNEAFADILGTAIEARTQGFADWILGDETTNPARNMKTPASGDCGNYTCPTKFSEYVPLGPNDDNGGVHVNSSIVNHAFYVLAEGSSGAIGLLAAEKIFYRALAFHLTRNSQFIDARLACVQAAEELYGTGSSQAVQTGLAFDSVEIYENSPTPEEPELPPFATTDSAFFIAKDNSTGNLRIGRREDALGDPPQGRWLSDTSVTGARPSVARASNLGVYVNVEHDLCYISTDGTGEACAGTPGIVHSVAISPNHGHFGYVRRSSNGQPINTIEVYFYATSEWETFNLVAPLIDTEVTSQNIVNADAMDFTLDGQYLFYDALTQVTLGSGEAFDAWAIYAIDLELKQTYTVVAPYQHWDIGFPSLSKTSVRYLVLDAFSSKDDTSHAIACDLRTGACSTVGSVVGMFSVPSYTGDDSAVVYHAKDPSDATRVSLFRQRVNEDRITPLGTSTNWLQNVHVGTVYRRSNSGQIAGRIENPTDLTFVSGIGVISGWVCDAARVDIAIGDQLLRAGYGTGRQDTVSACNDADNGFGLLINWNLLGTGEHAVGLYVDGILKDLVTVYVTTLGTEFLTGIENTHAYGGAYHLPNFPTEGQTTNIKWAESQQNFVIVSGTEQGTGSTGDTNRVLENPQPGSFQSGLGVISGWTCTAGRIDIEIDGQILNGAYGIGREDTRTRCGDASNGFAMLINWNLLGNGTHRLRALADGLAFADVTFVVTTLGTEFLTGASAAYLLPDFPHAGSTTTIQWEETAQNFLIVPSG